MDYKYFWRSGSSHAQDLYRLDATTFDGIFDFNHFELMELLLPDGSWVCGQSDIAEKDWMHGWFCENDEVSEKVAFELMDEWGIPR